MFVDEATFPGFRVQSMFDVERNSVPYYEQIENIMVEHYGPRNPLILATCDQPARVARLMTKDLLDNWRSDYWMRELSMVVVNKETNEVVSLLIVRTFRPLDLKKARQSMERDGGELSLLKLVQATLDQMALSGPLRSNEDADVVTRFRECVALDSKNLALGNPDYVPLVMEGARQLNVPKKSPKGIAVHLGALQTQRGAAMGAKFTLSYVNDLSNSASSAADNTAFGPVLFKDMPELTAGSERFSPVRSKAIFDQVKVPSTTGGVSATFYPGEVLRIYDIVAIMRRKSTSKL